ncbi:MAG: hypothetical protein R6V45_11715 [Oceanipulchritudo sp.]
MRNEATKHPCAGIPRLVLAGSGHAHLEVLRNLARLREAVVRYAKRGSRLSLVVGGGGAAALWPRPARPGWGRRSP